MTHNYSIFKLTIPPSVNKVWLRGKHGSYMAPKYRAWLDAHGPVVKPEWPTMARDVSIAVEIIDGKGWRSDRDIDNIFKAVLDLLVKNKVILDDNCKIVKRLSVEFLNVADRKQPAYIQVTVEGLPSETQD